MRKKIFPKIGKRRLKTKEDDEFRREESAKSALNELPLDYITDRLLPQIKYYERKGKHLQREYYIISILNTITLAAVPLLTMLLDDFPTLKYFLTGSSAIASIFSAVLLLRRTKDNWLEYQATGDALKCELARFFAENPEVSSLYYKYERLQNYEPTNRSTMPECIYKLQLFAKRCEDIMSAERTGWYNRMKVESDQDSVKSRVDTLTTGRHSVDKKDNC